MLDWRHDNPHRKLLQQRYSLFNDIREKDFRHTPGGGGRETRSGSGGREGRPGEGRDFFCETFRSTRAGRTIEMRLFGWFFYAHAQKHSDRGWEIWPSFFSIVGEFFPTIFQFFVKLLMRI